jgi:hypothetical protein
MEWIWAGGPDFRDASFQLIRVAAIDAWRPTKGRHPSSQKPAYPSQELKDHVSRMEGCINWHRAKRSGLGD